MPDLRERWHYVEYDIPTGIVVHDAQVDHRTQPDETLDDVRDRVLARGQGFLALDSDSELLDLPSRYRVVDGALQVRSEGD